MGKRLVICFDGTWNAADSGSEETNVAKLSRAIPGSDRDGTLQTVLYLRGVGTGGLTDRVLGGAFGEGVESNLRSGYMFIAQNYAPGDDIFLFGFSRGAFTARSLSGFIGASGLLKRGCLDEIASAWDYYRTKPSQRPGHPYEARKDSSCVRDVRIKCVGVWDTVGALGVPGDVFRSLTRNRFGFHDTQPSHIIDNAFHAVAIDEKRGAFVPTLWTLPPEDRTDTGQDRIEQVWFPGVHSDVGGGYAGPKPLSDIPLLWMADRASECGLGIDFGMLPSREGLDPLAPLHESRKMLSYSALDFARPTLRAIFGLDFAHAFNEKVYRPRDEQGRLLTTVGERLHHSALARFFRNAPGATGEVEYKPENLVPAAERARQDPSLVAD